MASVLGGSPSSAFSTDLSVDQQRQRLMFTVQDMAASAAVAGAPKEVTQFTTGIYAGQYECKYSYSADIGDLDVWGWSSTGARVGIWMTVPSHEYYNGGPMKRELTAHNSRSLLNILNGTHYSQGTQLVMQAGADFSKTRKGCGNGLFDGLEDNGTVPVDPTLTSCSL